MDILRLGMGVSELIAPGKSAALQMGSTPEHHEIVIARVLGCRQAGQAALSIITGRFRGAGMTVDIVHAGSMIALAVFGPVRTRRAAVIQTVIGGGFAAMGFLTAHRR